MDFMTWFYHTVCSNKKSIQPKCIKLNISLNCIGKLGVCTYVQQWRVGYIAQTKSARTQQAYWDVAPLLTFLMCKWEVAYC